MGTCSNLVFIYTSYMFCNLFQIDPGSITVLGIMGKIDQVDSVTGSLKLL
jgi:hypothetical protein